MNEASPPNAAVEGSGERFGDYVLVEEIAPGRKADEAGRPLRIVHRDVSPQNVLVSYDGDVKVVDFGIAKAVTENPEVTRGVLKGKLSYLSPEQVNGVGLDARTDVFAAGLVFYELLVGRKLFAKSDPAEVLDAIVHL